MMADRHHSCRRGLPQTSAFWRLPVALPRGTATIQRPRVPGALLGGASCESKTNTSNSTAFEVSSKRRKGFPSETHVKRGDRVVGGRKELFEKLGRNDPCPCESGRRFLERGVRRIGPGLLFS